MVRSPGLGFRTLSLLPNHTTKLGYPVTSMVPENAAGDVANFRATSPNVEYGSNARGGSSGGPWVRTMAFRARWADE